MTAINPYPAKLPTVCKVCQDALDGLEAMCVACGHHGDCVALDEIPTMAQQVREWADRRRLLHGMTTEVADLFELCAEDIAHGS